jgi:pimeloyl-ACP methyl ester carboxylesterase
VLRDIPATRSGEVQRDGAVVRWQAFGNGARTILLLPTWSIVHTDFWRRQVPYLASRYTVLTFDGLGNGASDRPADAVYYADEDFATDAVNVMDAAGVDEAAVLSASMGAAWQLLLAARVPHRVAASVYIAADLPLAPLPPAFAEAEAHFDEHLSERRRPRARATRRRRTGRTGWRRSRAALSRRRACQRRSRPIPRTPLPLARHLAMTLPSEGVGPRSEYADTGASARTPAQALPQPL